MINKKTKDIDNLLDDIDSLGLDVTSVFYRPLGYDIPIKEGDLNHDFGYEMVQNYRTANGIRMGSFTATDDADSGIVIFNKKVGIAFDYFATTEYAVRLNYNMPDIRDLSPRLYLGEELFQIPLNLHNKIRDFWKVKHGISMLSSEHNFTPAIVTFLLKLMKITVNLETGKITPGRSIEQMLNIIDWLIKRYSLFAGFTMPIASKVAAKTVGFDLVPVKPMSAPKGSIFQMDYVHATSTKAKARNKHKL